MDFLQELRYAIRSLAKSPLLTGAAVLTLGLGIGANAAMFEVVDRLFFRPPAHVVDPDRLVRIETHQSNRFFGDYDAPVGAYPRYEAFRDRAQSLSGVAAYGASYVSLGRGPDAQDIQVMMVTASFFPLLGVRPELGRFFTPDEDQKGSGSRVAVLSHELWHARFHEDPRVLGTTLTLARSVYTIIGVAPAGFSGIDLKGPDLWVPIAPAAPELIAPTALDITYYWMYGVVGRLRPGVEPAAAAAEGTAIYRNQFPTWHDSTTRVVMASVHEQPGTTKNKRLSVWLSVVAGLVLLIACANVANLLLARALQRRRELAVRLALGASRLRLARQLLAESIVIACGGGLAATLLTLLLARLVIGAFFWQGAIDNVLNLRIVAFTGVVVLATVVLAGLAPALLSGRADLSDALKSGTREGGTSRSRLRSALLAGQVALTVVLLSGAGLFVASLRNVRDIPVGFDAEHVTSVSMILSTLGYSAPDIDATYKRIGDRLRHEPGVDDIALAVGTPWGMGIAVSLSAPGVDSFPEFEGGGPYVNSVTPSYFHVMGNLIIRGRGFTDADGPGAPWVTIVNENMAARIWPNQDPVGKCLMIMTRPTCTLVIGVAQNTHRNQLVEKPGVGEYFIPLAQREPHSVHEPVTALLVHTTRPAEELSGNMQRDIQRAFADLPYPRVDSYASMFARELRPWKTGSTLLSLFGTLGLVLAAVGLFGVLSYIVTQRTQELGIRIALGAARRDVLGLVVGQGVRVTIIGIVIGVVAALLAGKAVASMLYGVSPRDPLILSLVAVILTVVAVAASYLPALRATRVDPMVALRYE